MYISMHISVYTVSHMCLSIDIAHQYVYRWVHISITECNVSFVSHSCISRLPSGDCMHGESLKLSSITDIFNDTQLELGLLLLKCGSSFPVLLQNSNSHWLILLSSPFFLASCFHFPLTSLLLCVFTQLQNCLFPKI